MWPFLHDLGVGAGCGARLRGYQTEDEESYRGAADEDPRLVRTIGAGSTGRVRAGEWVVERPHVIHFGANTGDRPVRILLATLFRNGSPPSIVVPD